MSIYEFPVELNKEKITSLRNKIESQKSIFSQKKYLDSLFLPSDIIGRERQAEQLIKHLDTRDGFLPPFVSVYGRSGSGKSTVVKLVCESLPDIISRTVTLRKAKTIFGCANLILSELGKKELKSADGTKKILHTIEKSIEKILYKENKRFFVLILDEFDVIFSEKNDSSDFVYKLLTLSERLREKGLWLCIISISNNTMMEQDFDDRVKSRIGNAEVFFEPYTEDDILYILKDRAKNALAIDTKPDILRYIAQICSEDHGDARRAIELLRISAETSKGKEITKENVDSAISQIQQDRFIAILKSANQNLKRAFACLARISYLTDSKWHTTNNIYKQLKWFVPENSVLSYRRFSDVLKELEAAGLCVSRTGSKGRYGYSSEFMLLVPPELVSCLNQSVFDEWITMKKSLFRKKYHPISKRADYKGKLARYNDEKTWQRWLGIYVVPTDEEDSRFY